MTALLNIIQHSKDTDQDNPSTHVPMSEDPSPNNPSSSAHHQHQPIVRTLDNAGDDEMDGDEDMYDCQDDDNNDMDIAAASDYDHDMEGGEGHPVPSPASGDPIPVCILTKNVWYDRLKNLLGHSVSHPSSDLRSDLPSRLSCCF